MDNSLIYFLQNFLNDALALGFQYYKPPFTDISAMDSHLRKGLYHTDELYASLREYMEQAEYGYFHAICDKFMLNYIIIRPYQDRQDIISIGPYLKTSVDAAFFNQIALMNHLNHSSLEAIRGYMYQFPMFDNDIKFVSILKDILNYITPSADNFTLKEVDLFNLFPDEYDYQPIDTYAVYADTVEKRYAIQNQIQEDVAAGDATAALADTKRFLSIPLEPRLKDVLMDTKSMMFSLNTVFRISAERSAIHPLFLHQISVKYVKLIEKCTTIEMLDKLHEKMIREYCHLVKNKSRIQYTPLIRDVLNYIEFHINQSLTLAALAEHFHVSAPYLSKLFKQEVGMTLTDYIVSQKIHIALRLLAATPMQIQEIAAYVGIYDCNYFTKIFRKNIGCTPSEYRKALHEGS